MKTLVKITMGIALLSLISINSKAQTKFITKNGLISFYSHTSVEDIAADNNQVACMFSSNGDVMVSLLMKSFKFKISLMEEHFNENYAESDKYPKATFKGKVENIADINFSANGEYKAMVKGELTIHGETKTIEVQGSVVIQDGNPRLKAMISVKPEDYKIIIPSLVREKIAETMDVKIDMPLTLAK
jgi:hypothetical protein